MVTDNTRMISRGHMKHQNVLDTTNYNTIFMVWNFKQDTAVKSAFAELCTRVINLNHSAETRFPMTESSIVLGIGHDAWLLLDLPKPLPKQLKNFETIEGDKHCAPATRGDIHLHIRGRNHAFCVDMASILSDILNPVAECVDEVHGFKYWDGRTILGFVDGTENPQGEERQAFALIGEEDSAYQGGSYLFIQKYLHDMRAWQTLDVAEQEKVIGRTKINDIEMSDDVKPTNSHSALANVGDDKKVVRDNMPFGCVADNQMGTYFIAYARYFSTLEEMLQRMFVGEPVGNYDRILDFSTAQTGCLFFVPTFDMLGDFIDNCQDNGN